MYQLTKLSKNSANILLLIFGKNESFMDIRKYILDVGEFWFLQNTFKDLLDEIMKNKKIIERKVEMERLSLKDIFRSKYQSRLWKKIESKILEIQEGKSIKDEEEDEH